MVFRTLTPILFALTLTTTALAQSISASSSETSRAIVGTGAFVSSSGGTTVSVFSSAFTSYSTLTSAAVNVDWKITITFTGSTVNAPTLVAGSTYQFVVTDTASAYAAVSGDASAHGEGSVGSATLSETQNGTGSKTPDDDVVTETKNYTVPSDVTMTMIGGSYRWVRTEMSSALASAASSTRNSPTGYVMMSASGGGKAVAAIPYSSITTHAN